MEIMRNKILGPTVLFRSGRDREAMREIMAIELLSRNKQEGYWKWRHHHLEFDVRVLMASWLADDR
jgi:ferredoxin-fold anticodon binding domain-containing protein